MKSVFRIIFVNSIKKYVMKVWKEDCDYVLKYHLYTIRRD